MTVCIFCCKEGHDSLKKNTWTFMQTQEFSFSKPSFSHLWSFLTKRKHLATRTFTKLFYYDHRNKLLNNYIFVNKIRVLNFANFFSNKFLTTSLITLCLWEPTTPSNFVPTYVYSQKCLVQTCLPVSARTGSFQWLDNFASKELKD